MPTAILFILLGSWASVSCFATVILPPEHLAAICGECPAGTTRDTSYGPYCGRCIYISQTCANGFYWEDKTSKCEGCPCRAYNANCLKDTDGQITCSCPKEYEGRHCERCSSGFVQESHYPYRCLEMQIRPVIQPLPTLPAGCPVDNTVQPQNLTRSARSVAITCPLNVNSPGQPCPTGSPCPIIAPGQPCPIGSPCPIIAPGQPCPIGSLCPIIVPGQPSPVVPLYPIIVPGQPSPVAPPYSINFPVQPCPIAAPCPINVPGQPCPVASPCPINVPGQPCPINVPGQPCPINVPGQPCPINVPGQPCPINVPGQPCPINVPGQPCPVNVPGQPCPIGPGVGCPGYPPSPCFPTAPPPPVPAPPPSPLPPPPPICPPFPPFPTIPACPPIPGCPTIPACPPIPGCPTIPPCPPTVPCPPIPGCPPIPPCPLIPPFPQVPPCPPLPTIPACPSCPPNYPCPNLTCPPIPDMYCNLTCAPCESEFLFPPDPCICDPRGTVRQNGKECICKVHVEGASCNSCKNGFFGLRHGNINGCSKCFCSGVTEYCTSAIMFRESRLISMNLVVLVDRTGTTHSVRHSSNSAEMTFTSGMQGEFYWILPPSEVSGNRIASYGSKIEAIREYSASLMTGSVPGNDVIIEGNNGVSLFWSATEPCPADTETEIVVRIQESDQWMVWRNGRAAIATRSDIMGVLASVERILLRASFTPTRMKRSTIRKIKFGTGVQRTTSEGFNLQIEECQCPDGYQGLSCENCSPGFYRDTNDMTRSIFGSCKKCPCRRNSVGCRLEFGSLICICKQGYGGPRCEDRDFVSVTLDPSRVRDCTGESITFNCTYASSSIVRVEFETIPPTFTRIDTVRFSNGISTTMKIEKNIDRVICKVLDANPGTSYIIAEVYSRIDAQDCTPPIKPPIGPLIRVEANPKFICVLEKEPVEFNCSAWSFASRKLRPTWTRAGIKSLPYSADTSTDGILRINKPSAGDTGTYYCSADDSSLVQLDSVVLVVRRKFENISYPFEEQDDDPIVLIETTEVVPGISSSATTTASLTIEGPPALYVSVLPSILEVSAGQSAEFKCDVTGENDELKMYWRKRNGTIKLDVNTNGSILHFNSVRKIHEGEYHCVVSNKLGKNSARAYLHVLDQESEAPQAHQVPAEKSLDLIVTMNPPNQVLRPGDKVVFTCEGNENDLKTSWSKENGTIRSEESNNPHLILHSVIPTDSGFYICSASSLNAGRTGRGRALLIVKPEEIAPTVVISESSPLVVKMGHRVHLECQTYGEPMPVVTWSRFINTTDGNEEQTLLESSTPNSIYEIRRVVKEHEGDYYCTGRNEVGQDRVSIHLEIDEGISCGSNEFRCHSGDQCVNVEDRCDKEKDCRDGSDERHCHRRVRILVGTGETHS